MSTLTIHPLVEQVAYLLLALSLLLALLRFVKGPNQIDRVVALDLIAGILLSFCILYAVTQNSVNFLNVALALAIIAFLGTVAIARFLEKGLQSKAIKHPYKDDAPDNDWGSSS